jgi:hypothetical protein
MREEQRLQAKADTNTQFDTIRFRGQRRKAEEKGRGRKGKARQVVGSLVRFISLISFIGRVGGWVGSKEDAWMDV